MAAERRPAAGNFSFRSWPSAEKGTVVPPGRQQTKVGGKKKETEKYEKRNCFFSGPIFICCLHPSTTNPTNGTNAFPVDRVLIGARYLIIMSVQCQENGINALDPAAKPIDYR